MTYDSLRHLRMRDRKNTILFIIEDLGPGGAQRQMVNLAIGLKRSGFRVSFLTYFHKEFYAGLLASEEIPHACIQIKHPLKRILAFRRFIRSGNFDAVVAFLGTPALLSELATFPFRRWKLVVSERSANPQILKSKLSYLKRFFHLFADFVVANSHTNIDMVRKVNPFLPERKCSVIYNAIDLELFKPIDDFKFRKAGKFVLIIPASYRRLKNILGLIDAVSVLPEEDKEQLEIHWYGDKTAFSNRDHILPEAELRITSLGLSAIFKLFDIDEQIQLRIQQADAVGLFSFFEGLPNAVCEGMACGKPIIASAVSDVPLLIEDRVNGVLCDAHNANSISDAISYMLKLDGAQLQQMGYLNRKRAEELFDQENIVNQYLQLL